MVTVPAAPSMVSSAPSGIRRLASATEPTQGMPSSRDTMLAWLPMAPMSVTTAPAARNSGVHDGSVDSVMRMSPGSKPSGSPGSCSTRARPVTTPGEQATPVNTSPADTGPRVAMPRLGQLLSGGHETSTMKGGSRSLSLAKSTSRSANGALNALDSPETHRGRPRLVDRSASR